MSAMNLPFWCSIVTCVSMVIAVWLVLRHRHAAGMGAPARWALLASCAIYALVALTNILEHGGVTDLFDPAEDVLEIVFLLSFLFFLHQWKSTRSLHQLSAKEAWLQAAFAAIGDGLLTTDADGRIRTINPEMARMLAHSADELVGRDVAKVLALVSRDHLAPIRPDLIADGIIHGARVILPDGVGLRVGTLLMPVIGSASPMVDAQGRVRGAVVVLRDLSPQEKLREQLMHVRKLDAIGQLAGGVAHDFNNMLGGILGAAELMERRLRKHQCPAPEGLDRLIAIVIEAAERAADLTAKLLNFSRKGKVVSTAIDLNEIVQSTLAIAVRTIDKSVRIEQQLAAGRLAIVGDPAQLQNALLNLLLNARDAMPGGGRVTVTTKATTLDPAWCGASPFKVEPGPFAVVSVEDTGQGIPLEIRERIFEPFFTTKGEGKGTGLGLPAVYGTIESHHGAIVLYSEIGVGTVFHLFFPLTTESAIRAHSSEAPLPTGSGCILVVDDEPVIRTTAGMMLSECGFTVLLASDGEEALALYRNRGHEIDAVLLDVVMPGLSGPAVAQQLRSLDPEVRIVMSSGFVREGNRVDGAAAFLKKPYHRSDLIATLNEVLGRPPG